MKIAESIYKGVVEPPYKKFTRVDDNCDAHIRQMIWYAVSSETHSNTSKYADKRKQSYLDHPGDQSKPTWIYKYPWTLNVRYLVVFVLCTQKE